MQNSHRAGRRRTWRAAVAGTAGAALIGIAALGTASAAAGEPGSAELRQTVQEEANAEPDAKALPEEGFAVERTQLRATEEYWTEERIAAAEPVEPPEVDAADVAAATAPSSVLPRQSAPGTMPDGVSPDAAGELERSLFLPIAERWHRQGEIPARTTGQLYFTRTDGGNGRCSASVIASENENMVWTAGHCVHDGESGPDGFYSNIIYIPDADNGTEPHGRWTYTYVNTNQGWSREGDFGYDYAAVALAPQAANGTVEGHLGAQGYDFGGEREFDDILALSYPSVGYLRDDFTGIHLWYCQGPTTESREHVRLECDMRSGASGSPWLRDFDADSGTGFLVAAHSYSLRNSDGTIHDEYSYGSPHGDGAIGVYNDVAQH